MPHLRRVLPLLIVCAGFAVPQEKYDGPRPPRPDIPFLVHANNLVETEVSEAREEKRGKDTTIYVVQGAASSTRTPVAEPIFLLVSETIAPDKIELYRMDVKDGRRQVVLSTKPKDSARPLRLMVTRLADKLYRIEVNEGLGLENGEYSLTPAGSNQVFLFSVY